LFLGLFVGAFLICACGVWIHDNRQWLTRRVRDSRQWLTHLFDGKRSTSRSQNYALPNLQFPNAPPIQDWSRFTPTEFTIPKVNIPPQIPRLPYLPPPPVQFP